VRQPHAEKSGTVLPDAAAHDDALQSDQPADSAFEVEEPGPVRHRVLPGEVADLHPADPDRDGVRVVRVVRLGDEDGLGRDTDAFGGASAHQVPEFVLVEALSHHLEVVAAAEADGVARGGRREYRRDGRPDGRCRLRSACRSEDPSEDAHRPMVSRREPEDMG
jgi:hypothetical protein